MVSHDVNAALEVCSHLVLTDPKGFVQSVAADAVTDAQLSHTYGVSVRLRTLEDRRFVLAGD